MAAINTIDTLNGLFKRRYAPKLERLIPEEFVLSNEIAFNKAKRLGSTFHQPVVLQREHGATYAASGDGAFTLDAAVAGQIQDAQVQGSQLVLRGAMDYESLAKGDGQGEHSFEDSNALLLENLLMSIKQRLEIALWYGQMGLATVSSVAALVITITTAEWAPGIWSGMEGAKLEIYAAGGVTQRPGVATITAVDIAARTITVDALPTGTVATDVLWFKTAHKPSGIVGNDKDMAGMHAIMINTGTLFNINAGTYSLWKSNIQSAGGVNLSFESIQDGVALAMGKGYKGEGTLYISTSTWAKLMTDQAALRRHGDPNKSADYEAGAESITFYTQAGKLNITSSICVKQGYGYLIQPKLWQRIGATDITFKVPGRGGDFYRQLDDQAGIEIRCYYHQAVFSKAPGKATLFNNIVNS